MCVCHCYCYCFVCWYERLLIPISPEVNQVLGNCWLRRVQWTQSTGSLIFPCQHFSTGWAESSVFLFAPTILISLQSHTYITFIDDSRATYLKYGNGMIGQCLCVYGANWFWHEHIMELNNYPHFIKLNQLGAFVMLFQVHNCRTINIISAVTLCATHAMNKSVNQAANTNQKW